MKRTSSAIAATILCSTFASVTLAADLSGTGGRAEVNVVISDDFKTAMNMCEYNHALMSPGGVVEMPVHIRGVTDDRNMARCFEGRWLPASIVHLPGEPVVQ